MLFRKCISLVFIGALAACTFGGGYDCYFCLENFKPGEFDATPDTARKSNQSITKTSTVLDFTDRAVEIYDEAGLDLSGVPENELDEVFDGASADAQQRLDEMPPEKQRKIKEMQYARENILYTVYSYLGLKAAGDLPYNKQFLQNMVKLINAIYYVESKGVITQKLDPAGLESVTDKSSLYDYVSDVDWDTIIYRYHDDSDRLLSDGSEYSTFITENGVIVGLNTKGGQKNSVRAFFTIQPPHRVGDTNVFDQDLPFGDGIHITRTFESFGNGKLKYNDFGYVTLKHYDSSGDLTNTTKHAAVFGMGDVLPVGIDSAMLPVNWKFKGTAVGLYTKNSNTKNPDYLEMRTNNATMNININGVDGGGLVLNIPFSESGWYDVRITNSEDGKGGNPITFSNYKGTDANRWSFDNGESVIETTADTNFIVNGDYAFAQPTEIVGSVSMDGGIGFDARSFHDNNLISATDINGGILPTIEDNDFVSYYSDPGNENAVVEMVAEEVASEYPAGPTPAPGEVFQAAFGLTPQN